MRHAKWRCGTLLRKAIIGFISFGKHDNWRYISEKCCIGKIGDMNMKLYKLIKVLGGKKVLQMSIQNQMALITLSNKGVTKDAFLHLAKYLFFSMYQIALLLPVTERTIQRYTLKNTSTVLYLSKYCKL